MERFTSVTFHNFKAFRHTPSRCRPSTFLLARTTRASRLSSLPFGFLRRVSEERGQERLNCFEGRWARRLVPCQPCGPSCGR